MTSGLSSAVTGAAAIAALATIGDFIWAEMPLRHRVALGLAHGAILFMAIGAYLGYVQRAPLRGAIAGVCVGLLAAASFYLSAPLIGYSAMFIVWACIWLAIAILDGRIVRAAKRPWGEVLTRGTLAMIGSGIGFYLISGIWRPFNPEGWDYLVHLVSWTFAFLPAFLALFVTRAKKGQTLSL